MVSLAKNLNDIDKLIIHELCHDASPTSHELAQKLRMAPSTVRRRVSNLIKSGAIRLIAVPNLELLGYEGWAVLGMNVALDRVDDVINELVVFDAIYTLASSFGRFDVIALVQFVTIDELRNFVGEIQSKITSIKHIETIVLTRPRKYYGLV